MLNQIYHYFKIDGTLSIHYHWLPDGDSTNIGNSGNACNIMSQALAIVHPFHLLFLIIANDARPTAIAAIMPAVAIFLFISFLHLFYVIITPVGIV